MIQITVTNHEPEAKTLHLLPTLWFRNTWSWDKDSEKPSLKLRQSDAEGAVIEASHPSLGQRWLYCQRNSNGSSPFRAASPANTPSETIPVHFTENETNQPQKCGRKGDRTLKNLD